MGEGLGQSAEGRRPFRLDEPTLGLDPQTRARVWDYLRDLKEGGGMTLLLTTHYMDEAERCHRLAILDHGVKVADGTPSELQANTGMHVVEVIAGDPYHAQVVIATIPEVASVTQLGVRLRVLIPDTHNDPTGVVNSALRNAGLDAQARLSSATLEDVFVAMTGRHLEED